MSRFGAGLFMSQACCWAGSTEELHFPQGNAPLWCGMLCQRWMHQGKVEQREDQAAGSHGLKAKSCCFLPWPWGQRGAVSVSLHPGDGDTAKQQRRGRRACLATWEAVNPGLTTTTHIRWEMPQKVTFLPVAQPGLWAAPAWMDCGSSQRDSLPASPSLTLICGGRPTTPDPF